MLSAISVIDISVEEAYNAFVELFDEKYSVISVINNKVYVEHHHNATIGSNVKLLNKYKIYKNLVKYNIVSNKFMSKFGSEEYKQLNNLQENNYYLIE